MPILVLAEHNNENLSDTTLTTVSAGMKIDSHIDILVVGYNVSKVSEQASQIKGINRVLEANNVIYSHQLVESVSPLIVGLSSKYTYVLAPATSNGKNILPHVAAQLDVDQISEVISVEDKNTFKRYKYTGQVVTTIRSNARIKVITICTSSFTPVSIQKCSVPIIEVVSKLPPLRLPLVLRETLNSSSLDSNLLNSKIVVSGGGGLKSSVDFGYLHTLARKLKGAVGASRAAVESGLAPNNIQIGQTGIVVAPDIYIAVGISGATQHISGMKDSRIIIAINQDENAPIMEVADYALVGDLSEILPKLNSLL